MYLWVYMPFKIAGREEPGRLPEVNSHWQACARELLSGAFAVVVSSPFSEFRRRGETVSILYLVLT